MLSIVDSETLSHKEGSDQGAFGLEAYWQHVMNVQGHTGGLNTRHLNPQTLTLNPKSYPRSPVTYTLGSCLQGPISFYTICNPRTYYMGTWASRDTANAKCPSNRRSRHSWLATSRISELRTLNPTLRVQRPK